MTRQISPPLTTVGVPIDTIAERAFDMLLSQIEGKTLENRHVALAAHLVARGTSSAVSDRFAAA